METQEKPSEKPSIRLLCESSEEWLRTALNDFNHFLIDHAACERKASATAVSFSVAYPDRPKLVEEMIGLAREELQHFHQVTRVMLKRGLKFEKDEKDPYIQGLMKHQRHGREARLLDRMLIFGIVEARGTERFRMVSEGIDDPEMKIFYRRLSDAEERHRDLFVDLSLEYFPQEVVASRLQELLEAEAELVRTLPLRAAVH